MTRTGVLRDIVLVEIAFALLLLPIINALLIVFSIQTDLIKYPVALLVALPLAFLFRRNGYSTKRLWKFAFMLYVIGLGIGLGIVGVYYLLFVELRLFSLPSMTESLLVVALLVFSLLSVVYYLSYRSVYSGKSLRG